ncbi:unnamed protein product [Phaedon cochleariae]|uniref:HMG box domain-containing protein n=1 Tax=Phaedon cochleariae TaxID=80249 RepID=A0A9P0DP36_PHACE|nr:unnamed protein product [Phaedon cochleariae]
MSENRSWGGQNEGVWWPNDMQHHQGFMQQQLEAAVNSTASPTEQLFSYKMASSFQNPATTVTNSTTTSPVGAQGIRGYDYSMTGGNPQMSAPAPGAQWWYPENMHSAIQSMQNSLHGMQQQQQQQLPPVHSPPSPQSEAQNLQEEAQQRQQQQHQEAVQRHQEALQQHHQEAQRQHQEALQQHHQQLQQQTHQLHQQQLQQLHNNHQQQILQHHQQQQQQHQLSLAPPPPLAQKGRMPRAKADARPRGRMTAYAFFVQTCREEHKKKHPEENVVFAEFSKKCAERWKTMLDKEKKRFHEMAEGDKKRFDTEMLSYTPPKGEKQRGKKRKQVKDPNAPKRSLSAFFWFSNDERSKVKAANPEYGVGDIAKELGRRWADCDPEDKSRYEALADQDKARYEKEMTAYKKKNNPAMQQAAVPVPEPEEPEEDEEEIDDDEDD